MIAVLSDIHGNLPALEAVLEDMPAQVSEMWILGDSVGELPYPAQVLDRLMEISEKLPVFAVRGNREASLLEARAGKHPDWWQGSQMRAMAWTADQLAPRHLEWLAALPPTIGRMRGKALLFHGTPDNVRGCVEDADMAQKAAGSLPQRYFFGGHIHQIRCFDMGDSIWMNAGAVGISLDRVGGVAAYLLVEEQADGEIAFSFRHVGYPVEHVAGEIEHSGLLALAPGIMRATLLELRTGRHYVLSLIAFARQYAASRLGLPVEHIPAALWAEAEALWPGDAWNGRA